jgi:hypothetical protein
MAEHEEETIPRTWLEQRVTLEQAEAENSSTGLPFGGVHEGWLALKAKARPGDQFWYFMSPPETWRHRAGRSGVALVRDGIPVDILVTRMN